MPCVQGAGLHQHVVGLRCNAGMHWENYADLMRLLFLFLSLIGVSSNEDQRTNAIESTCLSNIGNVFKSH